ncbi:hypothetical protein [Propionibacterium freudenreichii]|uniref:hypothetical protein n=1 Tax=Propionibacterium freudenreichii TaxID=1744 RepID=UPI000BC3430C|nr:hypothetical protein [Propionibacterium freudenreichii]SBM43926.1 Hypothetical protein PFR_JS2_1767 [Propionibacterium freudenreichii]
MVQIREWRAAGPADEHRLGALALVSVVTLIGTVVVVAAVSTAALLLDLSRARAHAGTPAPAMRVGAYAMMVVCFAMLAFGLWLIIPYFH